VVDQRDPLADDVFQLVDEQERGVFDVLAAAVDVRSLIGGQVLDQPFPQGSEEPLAGGLVRRFFRLGRLDGNTEPGAHADHVRGQERLAVVDHQGFRRARRHPGQPPVLGEHQLLRDAVISPACLLRPAGRRWLRHDRLAEDARYVDRFGRHRSDPKPSDRTGEQVLDDCQLRAYPPAGHRFHREHVQILGVQDRVLTGPHRPQPPVRALGPVSDRPAPFRAPRHRVGSPGQLAQPPVSSRRRRPRHHARTMQLIQPRSCLPQHRRARRRRIADHLSQHQPDRLIPARIDRCAPAPQHPDIGQARFPGFPVGRYPPLNSPCGDPEFFRLRLVAGLERQSRLILRTRFASTSPIRVPGLETGQDLTDMPGLFGDRFALLVRQASEHHPW
jgi:hypothetical protein